MDKVQGTPTSPWLRYVAIALLASALVTIVGMLVLTGGDPPDQAPTQSASEKSASDSPETRADPVTPEDGPRREVVAEPAALQNLPVAPGYLRVHGTVVAVDPQGLEHAEELDLLAKKAPSRHLFPNGQRSDEAPAGHQRNAYP